MATSEPGREVSGLRPHPSKKQPPSGRPLPACLTPTSWSCDAKGSLDLREWAEHGRRLGGIGRAVGWWIGDWLRYGNLQFGDRYARASRITGYDVQTLMNMVYVATHFDISQRREKLSWSHHAQVCALPVQERERWLDFAEREHLSVRCLRDELRRAQQLAASRLAHDNGGSSKLDAPQAHGNQDARPTREGAAGQAGVCPECGALLTGDAARPAVRRPVVSGRR